MSDSIPAPIVNAVRALFVDILANGDRVEITADAVKVVKGGAVPEVAEPAVKAAKVAELLGGVCMKTIKNYERKGLLVPIRNGRGYSVGYSADSVRRLLNGGKEA